MKKSDLKRIIREEVINMLRGDGLNEAFGDPALAKLDKMGLTNTRWRSFWRSVSKQYDIAWDKLPKGSVRKTLPTITPPDGHMAFYVINQDIDNPFASGSQWRWDTKLRGPAVLAVTIDGKIQYYGRDGGLGSKSATSTFRGTGDPVGKGVRGTMMVKKLKQLADDVYVFDLESYRGGTTALKSKRAKLTLGKDTFKDAKSWKQANLARYKEIINSRVGSRDQVDAMVAKIVKASNEAVAEAMALPKMGQYSELMATVSGQEVPLKNVTTAMGRALQYYGEYIANENDHEREYSEEDDTRRIGSTYYDRRKKEKAGEIKQILNKFTSGKLDGWY